MNGLRDALRLLERANVPSFVVWREARRCYFNVSARTANPMTLGQSGCRFERASPFVQDLMDRLEGAATAARALGFELNGLEYVGVPIFGIDATVDGWIVRAGTLEDVPLVYRELQSDASLLSQIAQLLPLIVFTVRPNGERDFVNRAFVEYSGLLLGGGTRFALDGLVHADDVAIVPAPWRAGAEAADLQTADLRLRRMDGGYRWHALRLTAVRSRSGAIIKWIGTLADIEDRRAAESTVAEINERLDARVDELERVLDVVPIGIAIANGFESDEVRINRALMEMLGEREPYVPYGHRAFRYLRAVDLEQTLPGEDGGSVEIEGGDGSTRFVDVSAMPLRALDGNGGVVAAFVDVSLERRRRARQVALRALHRSLSGASSVDEIFSALGLALEGFVDGFAIERSRSGIVERLVAGGEPPAEYAHDEELGLSEDRRKIVIDLRTAGRTLGRLTLCRATRSETFDGDDFDAFVDIAGLAAIALDRARLEVNQRLVAGRLGKLLLPSHLPEPAGAIVSAAYRAANDPTSSFGGWYDAFLLDDGGLAIATYHGIGRGADAAIPMVALRQAMRDAARFDARPGSVLAAANAFVNERFPGRDASAAFAVFEHDFATVRYGLTGGHPPPVLSDARGVRPLERGLDDLRAPAGAVFERSVAFEPDGAFALYSNGVDDVQNAATSDVARLCATVAACRAEQGPETLATATLDRFQGDGLGAYDRALIAVCRRRAAPRNVG